MTLGIGERLGVVAALVLACAGPAPAPAPPGRPTVLFVGLDGASWKVIGPMLEAGELPNLARLWRGGASTPAFETMRKEPGSSDGAPSPAIWTTVATCRDPATHGVRTYASELPGGQMIPVSSDARRVRALWEVATRGGRRVGVVNWWASWPAEPVNGFVVTNHANPAVAEFHVKDRSLWTADPAALRKMQRDFFPLDIAPVLARHWHPVEEYPYAELETRARLTAAQIDQVRRAAWNERETYSMLKTVFRIDYPNFLAAEDLLRERPVDLAMMYFASADPVQHYAWDLVEPERYAVPSADLSRDRGLVQGVYRYLDGFVGGLREVMPADAWLIVASDHGAEPLAAATGDPRVGRPGAHSFAAKGVLFIGGPHVIAGHRIAAASPYDLAPTLAWLLGLPVSLECDGKPIFEAFDPKFVAAHPVRTVPSWGLRERAEIGAPSPEDERMLEQLRSLGYIQ